MKNNSERTASLQLRTIIFEENGQKFVKKQAITSEAIPHLKKMKINHSKLSNSILNKNIKVVNIVDETEDSLTFEFIKGISLEQKFYDAIKDGEEAVNILLDEYIQLLTLGFKTINFDATTIDKVAFRKLFGHNDYSQFDGELSFANISNIDLIFSNILYTDNGIYLIDYEWVFEMNIPINFIMFRQFENFIFSDETRKNIYKKLNITTYKHIFTQMNTKFIMHYITDEFSFYQYASRYRQGSPNCYQFIAQVHSLQQQVATLGSDLNHARNIVTLRDQQLDTLPIKRIIKKLMPKPLWEQLKVIKPYLSIIKRHFTQPKKTIIPGYQYKEPILTQKLSDEITTFSQKPLISIIMPVFNVSPTWLNLAISSIEKQWYTNWELCIADDHSTNTETLDFLKGLNHPKIKIKFLDTNQNISAATNAALTLATGEYIALMDNDDEITPDALYEIVKAINVHGAEFIYSDEDFISTEGICSNPHYKPDFSPDLLLSHNYITHFTSFSKKLLDKVGGFNSEFDGSQDYDLFLRLTENTTNIYHIQKVLYHWRTLETSTSINSDVKPEALQRGKHALESALKRRKISATVLHTHMHHYFRVKYNIIDSPLVSIIMPFKDKPELLEMSITSILEKTTYGNFELIGISNNSIENKTFEIMKQLEAKDKRIKFHEYNVDFNYADINNYAVNTYAKGEHVLLLNNDIEIITPSWIEAMLEHSQRKEIGCVGAKLYYPNDTIQHAGIIIGLGGYAGHSHKMYPRNNPGYFNRLNVIQNLSAVTAACLMIKKSLYQEINGMDEIKFKIAYNDVDFCLRVREKGYLNIFTPYAEMYHHESISRGYETTPEKIARFKTERDALSIRHKYILDNGDPYYNPNLTVDEENFAICQK